MTIYDDMQKIASDLLVRFSQGEVKLVKLTPGNGPAYNPGLPTEVETRLKGATVKGASYKYVVSGLAVVSDLQVTMSATEGVIPDQADSVKIDGALHKIISIISKPAAGTPVVYVLIVRGIG